MKINSGCYGGEKQIQSVIRREDVFSNIGEQVAQVLLGDSKGSWPPSHGRSQYCLLLTKPPVSLGGWRKCSGYLVKI